MGEREEGVKIEKGERKNEKRKVRGMRRGGRGGEWQTRGRGLDTAHHHLSAKAATVRVLHHLQILSSNRYTDASMISGSH